MTESVLLFSEYYYPSIGGAQTVVKDLAEDLINDGVEVHVITSGARKLREVINNVTIYRFPITGNEVKGINGDVFSVQKVIDTVKPDAILVYALQTWFSDAVLSGALDISQVKKKVVVPCGLSCLATPVRRLLYSSYLRKLKKNLSVFDSWIFHAKGRDYKFLYQSLSRLNKADIVFIPNRVPKDFVVLGRSEAQKVLYENGLDFLVNKEFILNVSSHYSIKGHGRLIRWFGRYFKHIPYLVIAGNIPSSGRSCAKACNAVNKKNPKVIFVDGKDRQLIAALYAGATFFFLASYIEYAPLVLLEAQLSGLPFVTTNVGNAGNLKGGYIWPRRNSRRHQLANSLKINEMRCTLAHDGRTSARKMGRDQSIYRAYREVLLKSEG